MHTMFQSSGSQNGWSHYVYIIKITHDLFTLQKTKNLSLHSMGSSVNI